MSFMGGYYGVGSTTPIPPGMPKYPGDPGYPGGYGNPFALSGDRFEGQEKEEGGLPKPNIPNLGLNKLSQGMTQGAVQLGKAIVSPQGMMITAGAIGLGVLTGGAILPLLGVLGLAAGGYQLLKGVSNNNTGESGQGVLLGGLGLLALCAAPKSITIGDKVYALKPEAPLEGNKFLRGWQRMGFRKAENRAQTNSLPERMKGAVGLSSYQVVDRNGRAVEGESGKTIFELIGMKMMNTFERRL